MSNHPPLTLTNGLLHGTGKPSWFGTAADKEDNGIGSTGFNSRERPNAAYMSLPKEYWVKWKLVPFQAFTAVYTTPEGEERHVKPIMLTDIGPGGAASADDRMVDFGPSVAMRLTLTDNPDDITDKPVQIYSRKNKDGTWPVVPVNERY